MHVREREKEKGPEERQTRDERLKNPCKISTAQRMLEPLPEASRLYFVQCRFIPVPEVGTCRNQ
jgi:hypothetical protein